MSKYYHASPKKFKPGDVIGRHGLEIHMTSEPCPHYTILDKAVVENWHVYEVLPLGKVIIGTCWDEAICTQVQVVRQVGNARGIASNTRKHFIAHYWKHNKGSQIRWRRHVNIKNR